MSIFTAVLLVLLLAALIRFPTEPRPPVGRAIGYSIVIVLVLVKLLVPH